MYVMSLLTTLAVTFHQPFYKISMCLQSGASTLGAFEDVHVQLC